MRYFAFCLIFVVLFSVLSYSAFSETLSGEEILKRVDNNKIFEKIEYKGKMIIRKDDKVRTKSMHVYAEGENKALIEFTNSEDQGTRYLKLSDEMWMRFPYAEEIIKISGHMLRRSMMGSDFSYEDVMDNESLLEKYSITVAGSETIERDGEDPEKIDCYVLELDAAKKKITYAKQKVWVDKGRYVILKAQLFALSGELLKEVVAEKVQKYDNRYFATKITMTNKIIEGSSTTFEMEDIEFGAEIPDGVFTKRYLER